MSSLGPRREIAYEMFASLGALGRVCRLGLASRGNTHLPADAIRLALEGGVNYLNWCGYADGLSQAVRGLGQRRRAVVVAAQFSARTAVAARREVAEILGELGTGYIDVLTYYYVEHADEWEQIVSPGGAAEVLQALRAAGTVRAIGITSHQRPLLAQIARSGQVDLVMVRYNAAHRGAEHEVLPVTKRQGLPVVAFTALRWKALLAGTPDDPPGFVVPAAPDWYRFVLCQPDISVVLMAPDNESELLANLRLLDESREVTAQWLAELCAHGDRVRRHAGSFP